MKVRRDFLGPLRSTDKTTLIIKVSKDQELILSSTTPDTGYQLESDNPFPAGDHKAHIN